MKNVLMLILFFILLSTSAFAFSKSDFLQKVETKADITSAYTHYKVCNPTTTDYAISKAADFSVSFNEVKGGLTSYKFTRLESVPYQADDFTEACENVTTEYPGYTKNQTKAHNETVEKCDMKKSGSHMEYRDTWVEFNPAGKSLEAGKCYDIKVEGFYPPAYGENAISIDNIISYAGYEFDEYDWWNSNFTQKKEINISFDSGLTQTTNFPIKLVLNSSNINYSDFQSDCRDIRFADSSETNELDYFIEDCNLSGNSILYVNVSITNSSNTTIYMYFNESSDLSTTSSFNNTFGNTLHTFLSYNKDSSDLSDNKFITETETATYGHNGTDIIDRMDGRFDFASQWMRYTTPLPNGISDDEAFSISLWVRPTTTGGYKNIFENCHGCWDYGTLMRWGQTAGNVWSINLDSTGTDVTLTGSAPITAGNWYHLAVTYDGNTNSTLWNNAVVDDTDAANMGSFSPAYTTRVAVGAYHEGSASFTGQIDDVRIYKGKYLNQDEVHLLYAQPDYTIGKSQTPSDQNTANETQGRTAIETAIANALGSGYTTYTDQQIYSRHTNTSQNKGTFDKFVTYSNKRWAFNYDPDNNAGFTNMFNLTPTLYVLEIYGKTSTEITAQVEALINSTKD